jgi:hypothetical protein
VTRHQSDIIVRRSSAGSTASDRGGSRTPPCSSGGAERHARVRRHARRRNRLGPVRGLRPRRAAGGDGAKSASPTASSPTRACRSCAGSTSIRAPSGARSRAASGRSSAACRPTAGSSA